MTGTLYAESHEPYDAERHLLIGTRESAEVLAQLEYAWYIEAESPHLAPQYAARAVLPSLLVGNMRAAAHAYRSFTSALARDNQNLGVQDVGASTCDLRVFPSLPLLNFLGLLLLAVQRGEADLYRSLMGRYAQQLAELDGAWEAALTMIAEMYFDIAKPRQSNPLMDMMGSLFGGGGLGGGMPGAGGQGRPTRRVDNIGAEGLD